MDISNAVRQAQELENVLEKDHSFKEAINLKTPTLFSRLQRIRPSSAKGQIIEVKKCLSFTFNCSVFYPEELPELVLEFEFPMGYPSDSIANVTVSDGKNELKKCSAALRLYLEAFSGFECIELVLDWLAENKYKCLDESLENPSPARTLTSFPPSPDGEIQCYVLRYNHLLSGPEHKKEKSMIDCAKKSKLQGGLLWGTPGESIYI